MEGGAYPSGDEPRRVPAKLTLVLLDEIEDGAFGEDLARLVHRRAVDAVRPFFFQRRDGLVVPVVLSVIIC